MIDHAQTREDGPAGGWRHVLAKLLGVGPERKEAIYLEIARSASLKDASYWLQILFSAGIATLGLVTDSAAVIIGAMLISPLMGPILAVGLALAAGDLVLGLRAILNIALSCAVAVGFAVMLVALLPFKEVTSEIAARTHPNTLDLFIALFSGAVGSVAVCKEAKGVATSVPGVAIAVALMPPLCVVGYGLGVAASLDADEGLRVARGGGLLFLTNLVAITFTAMVIFLALHIDTPEVRERVRLWRRDDGETRLMRGLVKRLPAYERLRVIGGLPGRFLLVAVFLSLILVPLSRSFSRLRRELARKQEENRVKRIATQVWVADFARLPDGSPRDYLGQLSTTIELDEGTVSLALRVFTSKSFTDDEKEQYRRLVAARLGRPAGSVSLHLIEIPTATNELLKRADEAASRMSQPAATPAPTVPQPGASYAGAVRGALGNLTLPPPASLLDYEVAVGPGGAPHVRLAYLSDREIGGDAQNLIVARVRQLLDSPDAAVDLEWIASAWGPLKFGHNQAKLGAASTDLLDRLGRFLRERHSLRVEINAGEAKGEREGVGEARARAVADYLSKNYEIEPGRMAESVAAEKRRDVTLTLKAGAAE